MIRKVFFGFLKFVMPLLVLAGGLYIAYLFITTKPQAEKKAKENLPTLVETMRAEIIDQHIVVAQQGVVKPARQVSIHPQVSGIIIEQHPSLIPGGLLQEGELLARIEEEDYKYALEQQKAVVENATFNLKMEMGRKTIAENEWELLGDSVPANELGKQLALREPHIQNAQAALHAARSQLDKARLQLRRTRLHVPFNAIVLQENIDVGQYVSPQTQIATLAGTDRYWVQASIPFEDLKYIDIPKTPTQKGSQVRIIQESGMETRIVDEGYVIRLLGDLDQQSRQARVLIAVEDPLHLAKEEETEALHLMLGAYVDVEIDGGVLPDVCVLPRAAVREGNALWMMDENNMLEIRPIHIIRRQKDTVTIADAIREGERIVTSRIITPIPGMKLRESDTSKKVIQPPGDESVNYQMTANPETE